MHGNQRQGLHNLSYIGGLIDGEGSIFISRSCGGKGRITPSYTPRIKISMTDLEAVDYVLRETGYGTINREVDRRDGGVRKVLYMWQINSIDRCREFAMMIIPYLLIKTPQAQLMIDYCNNGRRVKKCMGGVPEDERRYREEVYEQMHKLNMRNRPQRLSPEASREDATV